MIDKKLTMIDLVEPEIWSIQANRAMGLSDISQMICGRALDLGSLVAYSDSKLLRLWPQKLLLLTADIDPTQLTQLKGNLTDVSHGYNLLQIDGESALEFINAHVPLDLESDTLQTRRVAKTQFANYSVIFWWDQSSRVQLLIDRSYFESFRESIESLINLWRNL